MKVIILAGGLGTRLAEETSVKPKPMVEVGGMPILWHIMKIYSSFGFNDFIICLGYKGYIIKEYFQNYLLHTSDVTFDLENGSFKIHDRRSEPWKVTLVDTGNETMTGGRLLRLRSYLEDEDEFMMTYGDGVGSINLSELIDFHKSHGKLATLTSVVPPGRFGALKFVQNSKVVSFTEKPSGDGARINGGFFVVNKKALDYIDGDSTIWEKEPLEQLSEEGNLYSYHHNGFWQPMDTLRDKIYLEQLWEGGSPPWKLWHDDD